MAQLAHHHRKQHPQQHAEHHPQHHSQHHPGGEPAGTAATTPARPGLLLALLSVAQFMVILDVTIVNVALPQIGDSLGLGRAALTWVVTGYTLAFGGLLIFGGRLADGYGRRRIFLTGLALFTVASLTSGLAQNGGMLLTSRIGQGIGAAMLSPAALSILVTEFTGARRNRALGVWAAIGGTGAAVGVLLGGVLTSGPGWEWAFLINVPIGLMVAVAVLGTVPVRPVHSRPRLDLPGAITGTGAVAALIYGLVDAGDEGWAGSWTLLSLGAAVGLAIVFVLIQRRTTAPLVPPRLLSRGPLAGAIIVMLGATALMMSAFFLTSIYLQHVRGFSPLRTGLLFLPAALATIIGAHLAARLVGKLGGRPVATVALTVTAAGLALMAWRGASGDVLLNLLPGFVLASAGIGASFVAATTSGMTGLDHRHAGVASGLLTTGHELGGSLGIATFSTIAVGGLLAGGAAAVDGFEQAFTVAAVISIGLAVAALALLPQGRPLADAPMFVH